MLVLVWRVVIAVVVCCVCVSTLRSSASVVQTPKVIEVITKVLEVLDSPVPSDFLPI
jgi:hypothetical protein